MTRIVDNRLLLALKETRIVPDGTNPYYPDASSYIKYGTTEYWDGQTGYIPSPGFIVIYSDYKSKTVDGQTVYIPGIKVGDGNAYVQDLMFIDEDIAEELWEHINNSNIHVTLQEKRSWNKKLNVNDNSEVVDEALIFIRD